MFLFSLLLQEVDKYRPRRARKRNSQMREPECKTPFPESYLYTATEEMRSFADNTSVTVEPEENDFPLTPWGDAVVNVLD